MRKSRRTILLLAILLSLGGVGYKAAEFVQRVQKEIKKNPLKALDYLPESALHMKEFHRAKIENGRKIWDLFGDEASYFKEQKEAIIKRARLWKPLATKRTFTSMKRNLREWNSVATSKFRFKGTCSSQRKPIICRRRIRSSCRTAPPSWEKG